MSEYLPKTVRAELDAARRSKRRQVRRMTIHAGEDIYPVLKIFDAGFSVDAERAAHLRGLVDIYDGPQHLYQALIVASAEDDGLMHFEYKRSTPAADQPPLDFVAVSDRPVGRLSDLT